MTHLLFILLFSVNLLSGNAGINQINRPEIATSFVKFDIVPSDSLLMAKKYFQEGVTAFPESYVINQLASKLAGK